MRVKILWAITLTVGVLVGWLIAQGQHQNNVRMVQNNVVAASIITDDTENKKTVQYYLEAVIANDQKKVLSLLSGEALQTTTINYRAHKPAGSSIKLDSYVLDTVSLNTDNTFSIINATVIYSKNDVLNQQLYKFYLSKIKNTWKIFKIEARQVEPPANLKPGDLNEDVKILITEYVKTSFIGNTLQHDNFLTGPALSAQSMFNKSFGNYKMTGFQFSDLKLKNVGSAPGYYLVRTSFTVTKPAGTTVKKELRTVLFEVVRINDQWKINHLYLEGVEPIG